MHREDAAFFDSAAPTRWFAWENQPTVGPQAPEKLRYLFNRTAQAGIAGSLDLRSLVPKWLSNFLPSWIPGSVSAGAGVAVDDKLHIGLYAYGGPAKSIGGDVEGGLSFQYSNAPDIKDLSGPFNNVSVHLGDIAAGSADYFSGPSDDGFVQGGGATIGAGDGASMSLGKTETYVCSSDGQCYH